MSNAQIASASFGPVSFSSLNGPSFSLSRNPFDVQAPDDAPVADVVQLLAFDERRAGYALKRPVVRAARLQLRMGLLPEELAVGLAERHQHAPIARLLRIARRLVVRADEHRSARDDRVAVALRSERDHPLHVLLRLDVPLGRRRLHRRHHVAIGRAAPHRPVAGAGVGRDQPRRGSGREDDEREQCKSQVHDVLSCGSRWSARTPTQFTAWAPGQPRRVTGSA